MAISISELLPKTLSSCFKPNHPSLTSLKRQNQWRRAPLIPLIYVFLSTITFPACVASQSLEWHSFEFNAGSDSPDICLLDYQYGSVKQPGRYVDSRFGKKGHCYFTDGINGPMIRGEHLYVKWRVKSTGKVYEDTVDLRERLPRNIKLSKIYFVVNETQLLVYLILNKRLDGCPTDLSNKAIECINNRKLPDGSVKGCPKDWNAAIRSAMPDNKVSILYCSRKILTLYRGFGKEVQTQL